MFDSLTLYNINILSRGVFVSGIMYTMLVTFINPEGRTNCADLSKEQLIKLFSMPNYNVVDFDLPEVNDRGMKIHRKAFAECESCSA